MLHNRKIAKRYAKAFAHEKMSETEIDSLIDELKSFIFARSVEISPNKSDLKVFKVSTFFSNPNPVTLWNCILSRSSPGKTNATGHESLLSGKRYYIQ